MGWLVPRVVGGLALAHHQCKGIAVALTTAERVKALLGISTMALDDSVKIVVAAAQSVVRSWLRRGYSEAVFHEWPERSTANVFYMSGNGYYNLQWSFRPLVSIQQLFLDSTGYWGRGTNAFASTTEQDEGVSWVIDYDDGGQQSSSGIIYRLLGASTSGAGAAMFSDDTGWYPGPAAGISIAPGSLALNGRRAANWPAGSGNIKLVNVVCGFETLPEDIAHATDMTAVWMFQNKERGNAVSSESYQGASVSVAQCEDVIPGPARSILKKYRVAAF